MKLKKDHWIHPCLSSLISILVFAFLLSTPLLLRFEFIFLDLYLRARPPIPLHPAILYIDIDAKTFKELGRFPWPRSYQAAVIHVLNKWNAKSIFLDIVMTQPSTETWQDLALVQALDEKKNVYLPTSLETSEKGGFKWTETKTPFNQHAKKIGHINFETDIDGTIRRFRPYQEVKGERYPSIALQIAFDYLGKPLSPETIREYPADTEGNWMINWSDSWLKHGHVSFVDLLRVHKAMQQNKMPSLLPEFIKDKICIIGFNMPLSVDMKSTPLNRAQPGPGIHGAILNSILINQYLRPCSYQTHVLILILLLPLCLWAFVPFRAVFSSFLGLAIMASILTAGYFSLVQGYWFYAFHSVLFVLFFMGFSAFWSKQQAEKEQQRLFYLATRDGLTGLFVKTFFTNALNRIIEDQKTKPLPFYLLMMDVDYFKKINDTHGHQAGDMVLRSAAQIIQSSLRYRRAEYEIDLVGRYGGEEIIVLLRHTATDDQAFLVAERLRQNIAQEKFSWEGLNIQVTFSIGVAQYQKGDSANDLIQRADKALYQAKQKGRNQTCVAPKA